MFFFFQAEDGIRDGHVTGVQTCALPIYDSFGSAVLAVLLTLGGIGALVVPLGIRMWNQLSEQQAAKIGRASCRERVKISVVAVGVKRKKGERVRRVEHAGECMPSGHAVL